MTHAGRQERLSAEESLALARRHADHFLQRAGEAQARFHGPEQTSSLDVLEVEHDNLRAALAWLLDNDGGEALTLAARLWPFWEMRGHIAEGRRWLDQALTGGAARTQARAEALRGAGILADAQDDGAAVLAQTEESAAVFREIGERRGLAYALAFLGYLHRADDPAQARALLEESLAICREREDLPGLIYVLNFLGRLALEGNRSAEARTILEERLATARSLGYQQGVAESLNLLGTTALLGDDHAGAQPLLEECLARYREMGNQKGIAYTLRSLGEIAFVLGLNDWARSRMEECLALLRQIGNAWNLLDVLQRLETVAERQGDAAATQAFGEEGRALLGRPGRSRGRQGTQNGQDD